MEKEGDYERKKLATSKFFVEHIPSSPRRSFAEEGLGLPIPALD